MNDDKFNLSDFIFLAIIILLMAVFAGLIWPAIVGGIAAFAIYKVITDFRYFLLFVGVSCAALSVVFHFAKTGGIF